MFDAVSAIFQPCHGNRRLASYINNHRLITVLFAYEFMYAVTPVKKIGDFIEPGTHRSTNIKVKLETLQKKSKIAFNPKI